MEPKPLNQFWRNMAWSITSGTPPHMTILVKVALCGWSGQRCDLSHLWVSFLFFFLFCLLRHAPRSHFLTDRNDRYVKTRVFGQGWALCGSRQYLSIFREWNPKHFPNWAGIGILKHKRRNWKIHISQKLVNGLTQNFSHFFRPPTTLHGWSSNTALQIQDGGRWILDKC